MEEAADHPLVRPEAGVEEAVGPKRMSEAEEGGQAEEEEKEQRQRQARMPAAVEGVGVGG